MIRVMSFVFGVLVCVQVAADDPPKKLTPGKRHELFDKMSKQFKAGQDALAASRFPEANKAFRAALQFAQQLYPKSEFPDGHSNIFASLLFHGIVLLSQGQYADAEPYLTDALAMSKRLSKGDHDDVADSLSILAG